MGQGFDETMRIDVRKTHHDVERAFRLAYRALEEKGYHPIHQLAGYLVSGDPAYITNHLDARNTIRRIERDDLIEELVRAYADSENHESARD